MMDPTDFLRVDPASTIPLASQLSQQLRWLIASRRVGAETTLPPLRRLGRQLGISLHTVSAAYRQLEVEGLVATRQGIGTMVLPASLERLAKGSAAPASFTIGVVIPTTYTGFYGQLLHGIQAAAAQDPSMFFICDSQEDTALVEAHLRELVARGVDGIIVVAREFENRGTADLLADSAHAFPPVVYADIPNYPPPAVYFDLENGSLQAARHLLGHGHRKIGIVAPPRSWSNVDRILRGFERGLMSEGLTISADSIAEVPDFSVDSGHSGALQLLDSKEPPTAILASGEGVAIGVLRAIKQLGRRVPDDVALIAFGAEDLLSELLDPSLTTFTLPVEEMGRAAYGMLRRLIDKEALDEAEVTLTGELRLRRSCGCG